MSSPKRGFERGQCSSKQPQRGAQGRAGKKRARNADDACAWLATKHEGERRRRRTRCAWNEGETSGKRKGKRKKNRNGAGNVVCAECVAACKGEKEVRKRERENYPRTLAQGARDGDGVALVFLAHRAS